VAQLETHLASGLIKFYSRDELKRFLKSLVEGYATQADQYGDRLGTILRGPKGKENQAGQKAPTPAEAKAKPQKGQEERGKPKSKGWVKMGSLLVNVTDPATGMTEVLFQLHEEAKQKLSKATDALKSFEELSSTTMPEAAIYSLQLRNGVPERIVVDPQERKTNTFSFDATFRLV
jgi:hypothetical protein